LLVRFQHGPLQQARTCGPVWYAEHRLPNGRQVQRKIGPARGRSGAAADRSERSVSRPSLCALGAVLVVEKLLA
jgi:hypothetical protein